MLAQFAFLILDHSRYGTKRFICPWP